MPGYQYLLRRLLHLAITQLVVITLIFGLFRLLPGDPASAMVDPLAPPESRQLLLKQQDFPGSLEGDRNA